MRIILISLAVAAFVIAIHQTFLVGIWGSYFIYMLALGLIFLARMAKPHARPEAADAAAPTKTTKDKKTKK